MYFIIACWSHADLSVQNNPLSTVFRHASTFCGEVTSRVDACWQHPLSLEEQGRSQAHQARPFACRQTELHLPSTVSAQSWSPRFCCGFISQWLLVAVMSKTSQPPSDAWTFLESSKKVSASLKVRADGFQNGATQSYCETHVVTYTPHFKQITQLLGLLRRSTANKTCLCTLNVANPQRSTKKKPYGSLKAFLFRVQEVLTSSNTPDKWGITDGCLSSKPKSERLLVYSSSSHLFYPCHADRSPWKTRYFLEKYLVLKTGDSVCKSHLFIFVCKLRTANKVKDVAVKEAVSSNRLQCCAIKHAKISTCLMGKAFEELLIIYISPLTWPRHQASIMSELKKLCLVICIGFVSSGGLDKATLCGDLVPVRKTFHVAPRHQESFMC